MSPTLADRCIRIFLRRKLPSEKIEKFSERKLSGYLQDKRDNLHRFGLLFGPAIAKKYSAADSLPIPKEADDRARDILEPLFAIAAVLDERNGSLKLTKQLINAGEQIAKDRTNDEGEDEVIVATLEALAQNFPKKADQWILPSSEATELFSKHEMLEWVEKRSQAARLLRQLGFRSGSHRNDQSKVVRAYRISKHTLDDFCERYGVSPPRNSPMER